MNIFGDYKLNRACLPEDMGGRVKAILHIKNVFKVNVAEAKRLVEALSEYNEEGLNVDEDVISELKRGGWYLTFKTPSEVGRTEEELGRKKEEDIAKAKFEFLKNKTEMWYAGLDDFSKQMVLEYVETHPKEIYMAPVG